VAATGLVLLGPLLALIGATILATMDRPMLFRQVRPGLRGRRFELVKFRSMREERDDDGRPLDDDRRLTPLGRLLRRTSLDELPQLWNVLRGDMSLVGPRPLLMEYLPLYSAEQARRHEVRPGITGLAQVSGRNAIDWEERLRLDVWYVDHWSLWLDLKILARTVVGVARGAGLGEGVATMKPFVGSSGGRA
jgi:lipopolysaccharide/colanic/teichoic acid biosynthesis glycosyltransferase